MEPDHSAQTIGAYFVEQYYQILHHSPDLVHQFYDDTSKLARPKEDGSTTITTTMQAIKKKIVAFNSAKFRYEITSVDAQDSFDGGIQILVIGYLTGRNNSVRNFIQVLFLAPHHTRYIVLNDMFRYVDAHTHLAAKHDATEDTKKKRNKKKKAPAENNNGQLEMMNDTRESYPLTGAGAENSNVEPNTINWSGMVNKLTSFSPKYETERPCLIKAEGDDEEALQQHRVSMKSKNHKGRTRSKLDPEADERTSLDIFAKRNKSMRNTIVFDLHNQTVKEAMKILKIHLLFGAYVQSVRSFKVITGRGKHSPGKPKLKNAVINLLMKEGIAWKEEEDNPGVVRVDLDGQTNFSFLHSSSAKDTAPAVVRFNTFWPSEFLPAGYESNGFSPVLAS